MKFIHLGDLHLGKTLAEFDLYEDQACILTRILDLAKEEQADAVLIAGDVYDRANPGDGAMNLLDNFLACAADQGLSTYVISGNHDSDDKLNFGSRFFEKNHVYIYAVFDGSLHKYVYQDAYGDVNIYMLPFVKASQVRHFYPDEEIDTYEDAVRVVLEHSDIDPSERNILIAHQFVAGKGDGAAPRLGGSESPAVKNVGNVERIGFTLFDRFAYTALGHIHSPQRVGREEVRYSGSPLKYSLSEVNDDKSVPVVTIDADGNIGIELKSLRPLRDMRHIKGRKDQLLSADYLENTQDFIYVTLTDDEPLDDAMSIFQQYYPNTIKIDYDNAHSAEMDIPEIDELAAQRSFSQLISEFYAQMYGTDISEEELALIQETAKEAGIE